MPRVAEIDRAILAQLRTNGRMSYVELAKEVGASERTVRTHVRKMEEDGTIRGYTVREGGVGLTALVRIKVSPGAEIGSFASEVTGWEGIEIIYEVSGSADLVALVHVDDTMHCESYSTRCGSLHRMKLPQQRPNWSLSNTDYSSSAGGFDSSFLAVSSGIP